MGARPPAAGLAAGKDLPLLVITAAAAMGTLARCRVYRTWASPGLTVQTRDGSPVTLSADGEVMTGDPKVTLRKRQDPLLAYRPQAWGRGR